jgi:hypothetical protein
MSMDEQGRQILAMLAEGKINANEAERLINALERHQAELAPVAGSRPKSRPRYLRVLVGSADDGSGDGPSRINIRVPLQLLRAGVRLTSLIPPQAVTRINTELSSRGVPIDLAELKPQQLEELIDQLDEVTIDVDDPDSTVQVFCE